MSITAGILGATGYAGIELARLLVSHPQVDRVLLSSNSQEGEQISKVYPHFSGAFVGAKVAGPLLSPGEVINAADCVFAALPAGLSGTSAVACCDKNIPFIDFSADFRFEDEQVYYAWYGRGFRFPDLHKLSVYGLPELNRQKIKDMVTARRGDTGCPIIIGNPGCYPTACSLAAFPALSKGIAGEGTIIADCASGITGGGRETKREFHYSEAADTVTPYAVGSHRHTPEITRNFWQMEGKTGRTVIFTPHLSPMNRGILATLYIPLKTSWLPLKKTTDDNKSPDVLALPLPQSAEIEERCAEIRWVYEAFYRDEPFVRVLPPGVAAATSRVRGSNFCDISVHLDNSGTTLIVASAIDNMVKGAAGQAVQNMNLIMGFDETEGLGMSPMVF
jgi:N-acetyl-gamma-glutamyl-phosphate reductase